MLKGNNRISEGLIEKKRSWNHSGLIPSYHFTIGVLYPNIMHVEKKRFSYGAITWIFWISLLYNHSWVIKNISTSGPLMVEM